MFINSTPTEPKLEMALPFKDLEAAQPQYFTPEKPVNSAALLSATAARVRMMVA